MNKLTPIGLLYINRVDSFIKKSNRRPTQDEKMEIYIKSKYDYKHASLYDRLIFDRDVEMINDINHTNNEEERKSKKKYKSKLNRKK